MERMITRFQKNSRERVRVFIKNFRGHEIVDMRVYWSTDGKDWYPSRKGIAMTIEKLPILIASLQEAANMVGHVFDPTDDDEILSDAEKIQLSEMFKIEPERLEGQITE